MSKEIIRLSAAVNDLATNHSQSALALPLHSSQDLQWKGMLVEHRHRLSGEIFVPALHEHFLVMHVRSAQPVQLLQIREGKTSQTSFQNSDLSLMPAGRESFWYQEGESDVLRFCLQPALLSEIAVSIDLNPERIELLNQFVFRDAQIEAIGQAFLHELYSPEVGGRLYVESLTTTLAIHLLRRYTTGNLRPPLQTAKGLSSSMLLLALDYLHEHLADDITLSQLAAAVSLSPYHFTRLFKLSTGTTPHQYLLSCRLQQAYRLLRSTNLPIGQVALQTGFADQSHFTRHFKRAFAQTPAELRKEFCH